LGEVFNALLKKVDGKTDIGKIEQIVTQAKDLSPEIGSLWEQWKEEQGVQPNTLQEQNTTEVENLTPITGIPAKLKTYQENRLAGIEGINDAKKQKMKAVADKLIQDGKVSYIPHPSGKGFITKFTNIQGMGNTQFYDATQLVELEITNRKEMTCTHTYDASFSEQKTQNLVRLRAIRGKNLSGWKSQKIANIVEQQEQYGLYFHSEEEMKMVFFSL
jgi:uncharacterized protein YcaQ